MRVLYFAWVRERIGRDEDRLDPPPAVTTVAGLLDWMGRDDPVRAGAFADRTRLRAAADGRFVPLDAPIAGVSEIAIFPPVTGG
ncbi:molybdopterin synthase sulfur carrier subunit [Sphingomonas jejuensis]|uniref:Molybdopterin synthase sulfur carrier subunit n=1 Tax=Sphingomonas jejuensis TaxID=904715 RepID=A0ABX0XLF1_9SPHN|nr:molybdopterin synthase sulfur carrier subunit [Sphingomonas jejuensis]